ncbi:hypothetical protein [Nocardia sp. NRRL S-836]|uniref:hypothetical protein n=1 Tax=Nocardia sp. NRRL S-836 TaxID=1519492 RepID=UPI0006ADA40D|nr:hypothetical protein [Nocardia sp. NRRL S-836]KOV84736.1 hypothetical protein ADL03_15845 [Nocardia sp. NRRL S-836]
MLAPDQLDIYRALRSRGTSIHYAREVATFIPLPHTTTPLRTSEGAEVFDEFNEAYQDFYGDKASRYYDGSALVIDVPVQGNISGYTVTLHVEHGDLCDISDLGYFSDQPEPDAISTEGHENGAYFIPATTEDEWRAILRRSHGRHQAWLLAREHVKEALSDAINAYTIRIVVTVTDASGRKLGRDDSVTDVNSINTFANPNHNYLHYAHTMGIIKNALLIAYTRLADRHALAAALATAAAVSGPINIKVITQELEALDRCLQNSDPARATTAITATPAGSGYTTLSLDITAEQAFSIVEGLARRTPIDPAAAALLGHLAHHIAHPWPLPPALLSYNPSWT